MFMMPGSRSKGRVTQARLGRGTYGANAILGGDNKWVTSPRKLLNTLTASASATLDDTTSLTSSFSDYEIIFENVVPVTNAVNFFVRAQVSGAFQSTGYHTNVVGMVAGTLSFSNSTTVLLQSINDVPNTAGQGLSGRLILNGPVSTTNNNKILSGVFGYYNGTNMVTLTTAGQYDASQAAVTGLRFLFSSGNISTGTIKIYGLN